MFTDHCDLRCSSQLLQETFKDTFIPLFLHFVHSTSLCNFHSRLSLQILGLVLIVTVSLQFFSFYIFSTLNLSFLPMQCYATMGTSYSPVCVCLDRWMDGSSCFFGVWASFDLSYTVLYGNSYVCKNKGTSVWNFVPNSGLRTFSFGISIAEMCN